MSHHTLTALLHYLVKNKFSEITMTGIKTHGKGYFLEQFSANFRT